VKVFAIGDIHGAYKALLQCFERADFDYQKDRLIVLGDVCDGYSDVRQCIDELLKLKHCDFIIGNHDKWTLDWGLYGTMPEIWTSQGGRQTMASYGGGPMPQEHIDFLKGGQLWLELEDMLFVHGGFDPEIPLAKQSAQFLMWDRELLDLAWKFKWLGRTKSFGGYK